MTGGAESRALVLAIGIGLVIVITGYATSRAVAIAWFRTKLEYIRSVFKEGDRRG